MYLQNSIGAVLTELTDALERIENEQYSQRSKHLNSSTGQHVRHTIELFQALINGYESGLVNYDNRIRDLAVETDKALAIGLLNRITEEINLPDKKLELEASFSGMNGNFVRIESNYNRELAYNFEHAIHHMALIRVGLEELTQIKVSDGFGVAASTIKYRAQCAQ